jgi:hypothetical protein
MSPRITPAITPRAMVAAWLLAVAALLAGALPAGARTTCTMLKPKSRTAPYLIAPCEGATVAEHRAVTFIVYDSDPRTRLSAGEHPYLDLATERSVSRGQLAASTNGTGVFQQLSPRRGHPHEWILTVRPQTYRSWWDNHPGTCFVQVRQLDPAAADGIIDSPIVMLHVAPARR